MLKIYRQIIAQKALSGTREGSLYKRLERLVQDDYLSLLPPEKGGKARIYQITNKACLAMAWDSINEQTVIDQANEQERGFILASILKAAVKEPFS